MTAGAFFAKVELMQYLFALNDSAGFDFRALAGHKENA